jgi:hypothetical protein
MCKYAEQLERVQTQFVKFSRNIGSRISVRRKPHRNSTGSGLFLTFIPYPRSSFYAFYFSDEHRGRVVNTPTLYSGSSGFDPRSRRPAITIKVFRALPHSFQSNDGIVP